MRWQAYPNNWIVDPRIGWCSVKAYRLADEDYFIEIPADESGRIPSIIIPGLLIDPIWVSKDPLPNPLRVFADMVPDALTNIVD